MEVMKFKKAIAHIRTSIGEMPVQQIEMFCHIAEQENQIAQVDLIRLMGLPQGTISRNVSRLSNKLVQNVKGETVNIGYGLVDSELDGTGKRENLFLTSKGKKLYSTLQTILK